MEQMNFAEMHVFPYSKRTGTPAARMDDQVDEEVKNERVHELIDLSERQQLKYAQAMSASAGRHSGALAQRAARTGEIAGYSDNYLHVIFNGSEELVGQVCRVKITEAGVNECRGELVAVSEPVEAHAGVQAAGHIAASGA